MSRIKVGYIGDSPFIFSGFGNVARAIMEPWPEEIEVHVLGTMVDWVPEDIGKFKSYWPSCKHDLMALDMMLPFIRKVNPDVLFFIGDPGSLRNRFGKLVPEGVPMRYPFVSYFPIEGAPLNPHIVEQSRMVAFPVTYTEWGMNLLRQHPRTEQIDYVWHGFDHANFEQYDENRRDEIRKSVGWGDKFVVGVVAVNKRGNRYPSIIEAARILKDRGHDDIVFYFHCQDKDDTFVLAGWELRWMIAHHDLEDMIVLKPNQGEHKYLGRPIESDVEALPVASAEAEITNLSNIGFVDLLNCFDLYLDAASVHGFNLPAGEAARCGVPVISVDDGFARTEIYSDVALMMKPDSWDYWHTGARLALVDPEQIADYVGALKNSSELRLEYASAGKKRFDGLKWKTASDLFQEKIVNAYEYGKELTKQLSP